MSVSHINRFVINGTFLYCHFRLYFPEPRFPCPFSYSRSALTTHMCYAGHNVATHKRTFTNLIYVSVNIQHIISIML